MLRKFNRTLAYLLSFALVMSIFGHDYSSFTSIAADEDYAQEVTENQEETQEPAAEAPQENYEEENNSAPEESYDEGSEGGEENYDEGQPEEPAEEPQPEEPQEDPQPEQPEAPETPETPKTPEEPETPEAPAENPEQPSDESGEGSGEEAAPPSEEAEDEAGTASSTDEENTEGAAEASSGASIEDDEDAAASASSSAPDEIDEEEKEEKKEKKEKEQKEVETQMPAADFYGSAGGMNVSVHADEGAFPEGTEMVVSAISAGEALDAAVEALGENVTEAIGVDISFRYEEQEIEPANAAAVHVNISLSSSLDGDSFSVVHKDDDGSVEKIADACADGASFETGSFSIYIVVGEGNSSNDEEDEYHATATYNFYVGEELKHTQIVKKGDTLSEPPIPDLSKTQVFHGWFIRGTNNKPPYGEIVSVTAGDIINVDARIQTTYYLTFIGPSGEIVQVKEKIVEGDEEPIISTSGVSVTPKGETQAFIGWTTEEDTRIDTTLPDNRRIVTEVNAKNNDTVYAVINTAHWLNFDANDDATGGGATYTSPVYVLQNQIPADVKPEDPTRRGYDFGGWYTDPGCGDASAFKWNESIDHDVNLFAKWTKKQNNPYTVVIWKQKASDAVNATPKTYDFVESHNCTGPTDATITPEMLSGYLTALGTGFENPRYEIVKGNTGEPATTIRDKGDTVVNIYHDRKAYTLTFKEKTTSQSNIKVINALYEHVITDYFPIDNKGSRWKAHDTSLFTEVLVVINLMPAESITFTKDTSNAGTKYMNFNVEKLYGTGYELRNTVTAKYNFITEAEDYIDLLGFDKHHTDPAFVNGKALDGYGAGNTINFYYTRKRYTIAFVNDTTEVKTITEIPYEMPLAGYASQAPNADQMEKRAGFTFEGWFVDSKGIQEFNWNQTMPANNLVLYAHYEPVKYNVDINPNEGVYTAGTHFTLKYIPETGKFEEVSRDTLNNNISREGYELVGWFWDDDSNEPYAFGQPTCDIKLIAKWRNPGKVKITYVAGENGTGQVPVDTYEYSPSSTVVVGAPAEPKAKYTFIGWKIRNDSSGRIYYPNNCFEIIPAYVIGTGEVKDVFLDAIFAPTGAIGDDSFTKITYKPNGGSGNDIVITTLKVNEGVAALTQEGCGYTKENCELIGWAKNSGSTTPDIELGQIIAADNDEYPNVLYAVWKVKKVNYSIKYYRDSVADANLIEEVVKGHVELGTSAASISLSDDELNAKKPEGYRNGEQQGDKPFIVTEAGPNVINVVYPRISLKVTIQGNTGTFTYNGTEQTVSGYEVVSILDENDVPVSDFTAANVALKEGVQAAAKRTEVGTTNMGLSSASFQAINTSYIDVTFEVTDGSITIKAIDAVVVTITGHNNTATYDGNEHSVSGYDVEISNPLYKESYFTFSGTSEAKRTDVGTTNMGLAADQFTNTNSNFGTVTFAVTDGYQTIEPLDVTVTITGHNNTATYDGNEHSVSGYDVEISNPLYKESYFTFSGTAEAKRTIAGTTNMGLAADQFTNTNSNFGTVTFAVTDGSQTINPIDVTVTITGHHNTATFDNEEHSVSGYDVEISNPLYTEDDFSFSGTAEAKRTDVGTTDMGLAADQFTNTNDNFATVTFNVTDGYQTITPVDTVIVTITGHHNTAAYDGQEHSVSGYDVETSNPLYTEADFTFTGNQLAKMTNVGTDFMGLTADNFTNTSSNFATVTFNVTDGYQTIEAVNVTVTITGHNTKVDFDGEEHSASGYDVEISNTLYKEAYFTFSGTQEAKRTEVGTTEMGLAADQFANTNNNFGTVTFEVTDGFVTIDPINVTVTITGHKNETNYDGNEHSVNGYDVEISNPLYKESDFTFDGNQDAARTDAGTTNMGLAAEQFTNNNTNFGTVTFEVTDGYQTINPIDVTVTITGDIVTATYDAKEHKAEGYDVAVSNSLYTTDDIAFSGTAEAARTEVGTTNMNLAEDQFSNTNPNFGTVTFNVTDGYVKITEVGEVTVTIIGAFNTAEYDGKEHSVSGYDYQSSDPLYTDADFTFTGTAAASQTDVGKAEMGLTADNFSNTNTNFKKVTFEVKDGYQEITAVPVTVTVIGKTDSREYDGEEHTVEGFEISADKENYLVNEYMSFTGTAQATRTDAGKTMMNLTAEQFKNESTNFSPVTVNVTDGYQEIKEKEITIKVVGNSATVEYNGKEQSVTGYEMTIPAGTSLTKNDVKFVGSATASGIALGTYKMGLTKDQFSVADKNYKVTFEVTDGTLTITGTPGAYNITITSDSDEQVYTGETFGGYGYTVSTGSSAPRAMAAMSEAEFTEAGSDKVVVNGAAYTVTGITVDTTAREVGEYDIEIKGTPQVIDSFGNNVTELFTINKVTGKLVITPMAITVTSASASKVYDGTPLTSDEITEDPGWGKGDVVAYNVTGSQTEVGTSKNTFEIVASEDILKNYTITKVEGDLEVTAASTPTPGPTPTPDTPTPTPTPDTPTPAPAPTTIDDAPVPMAPTAPTPAPTPGVEAVLGARRERAATNNAAVLGARRGKTDDETNTTSRAFAIILAAAAALALIIKVLMKKEEDEEA